MKKLLAVLALIGLAVGVQAYLLNRVEANPAPKVVICHHTGSESNPTETIEVSENAVQAHIDNHGDTLGECPVVEEPPIEEEPPVDRPDKPEKPNDGFSFSKKVKPNPIVPLSEQAGK